MRGLLSILRGRAFSCFYLIGELCREALDLSLQRVDLLGLCLGGYAVLISRPAAQAGLFDGFDQLLIELPLRLYQMFDDGLLYGRRSFLFYNFFQLLFQSFPGDGAFRQVLRGFSGFLDAPVRIVKESAQLFVLGFEATYVHPHRGAHARGDEKHLQKGDVSPLHEMFVSLVERYCSPWSIEACAENDG